MDAEETKDLWCKILSDDQMKNGSVQKTYRGLRFEKLIDNDEKNDVAPNDVTPKVQGDQNFTNLNKQKNIAHDNEEKITKKTERATSIDQKPRDSFESSVKTYDDDNEDEIVEYDAVKQSVSSLSTKDFLEAGYYKRSLILRSVLSIAHFIKRVFSYIATTIAKIKPSYIAIIVSVTIFATMAIHFSRLGKLTSVHAAIDVGKQNCHYCHSQTKNSREDALQCTICHQQAYNNSAELNVHGLSNEDWQQHNRQFSIPKNNTDGSFAKTLEQASILKKTNHLPQLACSACHKEHQGRNFDLTKLSNKKCQTCHTQKFNGFSTNHPDFVRYPYKRRTNIMFDHKTHFNKYFVDKKEEGVQNIPNKCDACHSGHRQFMGIRSFEETCKQCHNEDIFKFDEDIDVLRFPGFLMEDFYAYSRQLKIRPQFKKWPSVYEELSGESTEFMRLLLSKDKELEDEDINEYLEVYFYDTIAESPGDEDRNEIKAMNAYVIMIKRLCDEIAKEDSSALSERLQKVLKVPMDNQKLKNLFPDVSNMLEVIRSRIIPPINPRKNERFNAFEFEEKEAPTGWYFYSYTLKYRPHKHRDPMMKAWLDLMAKTYNTDKISTEDEANGNTHYIMRTLDRCLKCHSVEKAEQRNSVLKINWKPSSPKYAPKFTRFSHQPHILVQKDCYSCHTFNKYFYKDVYDRAFYENDDPKKFMNEFKFITKDLCSKCHNHNIVGENCTSCHNYHATPFKKKLYGSANLVMNQVDDTVKNKNNVITHNAPRKKNIHGENNKKNTSTKTVKSEKTKPSENKTSQHKPKNGSLSSQEIQQIKKISAIKNIPRNDKKTVGAEKCSECHKQQKKVWENTRHHKTYDELDENVHAKQILQNLGIEEKPRKSKRCSDCHFTQRHDGNSVVNISGVSCESCHGEGKDWLLLHADKTKDKAKRRQASEKLGMKNIEDIYSIAEQCYKCHTIIDEELINVGGHKSDSKFELVSWSQGSIHHKVSQKTTQEKLRVTFIIGLMLDLEYALRGLLKVTKPGKYYNTMQQKVNNAYTKLRAANTQLGKVAEIQELVSLLKRLNMKNRKHLEMGASVITFKARQFIKNNDGSKLGSIDGFIPKNYK
ncbi:multiheme c-type cytochrome [Candidatus Uabimicrobium amorphum]|uniref:Cytochrome c554 n=1 Tax=Uabimicrobium amorphum TaxID=2596890 RepID=A0A5S9IR86_UABAM|nr:multiheme c-type cytochrome [Candidatus Uabimicrobium amorphum]BBM86247.1 cytochrome c554 [Candidatus Uabimicrobium amorphum]